MSSDAWDRASPAQQAAADAEAHRLVSSPMIEPWPRCIARALLDAEERGREAGYAAGWHVGQEVEREGIARHLESLIAPGGWSKAAIVEAIRQRAQQPPQPAPRVCDYCASDLPHRRGSMCLKAQPTPVDHSTRLRDTPAAEYVAVLENALQRVQAVCGRVLSGDREKKMLVAGLEAAASEASAALRAAGREPR